MEKRKEIITREIFISEKKKMFTKSLWLVSLVILPLLTALILCFSFIFRYHWIVFSVLETIFVSVLILYGCIPMIKDWSNIKKNKFFVCQDTLRDSQQGYGDTARGFFYKPYTLYFSTYGKYEIPTLNYTWSEEFKATDEDVYNRACKGDTFYLFIAGKTILEAYNTKVFEYKE